MVDRIVNAFSYVSKYRPNSSKKLLIKVFVRSYQSYSPFVHSPTNGLALCNNVASVVMRFFLSYCSQISVTVTQCIICIYLHIHAAKNTTICQTVSLCNMHRNVIHNYMFRPYKWAIIRLFIEPVR